MSVKPPLPPGINGLIHAWCYFAAQMVQSISDFDVTILSHIISVELRPAWILQYFRKYVGKRTTVALYKVCSAVVPRATTNSRFDTCILVYSNDFLFTSKFLTRGVQMSLYYWIDKHVYRMKLSLSLCLCFHCNDIFPCGPGLFGTSILDFITVKDDGDGDNWSHKTHA